MARLISNREVASVLLFSLEISESELEVYAVAMKHLLMNADDETIDRICGATRGEIEGMLSDLVELIEDFGLEPVEGEPVS